MVATLKHQYILLCIYTKGPYCSLLNLISPITVLKMKQE